MRIRFHVPVLGAEKPVVVCAHANTMMSPTAMLAGVVAVPLVPLVTLTRVGVPREHWANALEPEASEKSAIGAISASIRIFMIRNTGS